MITLTRTQVLLAAVPLVALLALAGSRLAATGTARAPERAARLAVVDREPRAVGRLVVHVVGAVRRGGLYRMRDGARVADALGRAGGPTRRADLTAVNLAAPLVDGQQVIVPVRVAAGAGAPAGAPAPGAKVSLNSATVDQLDELPGIGPVTAEKIVAWRTTNGPLRSVDDLDAIPGIGPARVEQLRDLVGP
ncbi:MAG: helix-hairpin-helix domain-containing protein [Gaiella sp.]